MTAPSLLTQPSITFTAPSRGLWRPFRERVAAAARVAMAGRGPLYGPVTVGVEISSPDALGRDRLRADAEEVVLAMVGVAIYDSRQVLRLRCGQERGELAARVEVSPWRGPRERVAP